MVPEGVISAKVKLTVMGIISKPFFSQENPTFAEFHGASYYFKQSCLSCTHRAKYGCERLLFYFYGNIL